MRRFPEMRILSYCLMPNHWHLVLLPLVYGLLSDFMQWVEATHTARWNRDHDRVGQGGIYQGRFKSFPIEDGDHLANVMRYVERNALEAGLVRSAEQWHWGSLHYRPVDPSPALALACPFVLGEIPWMTPAEWIDHVNTPLATSVRRTLKQCELTGEPFGSEPFKARFTESVPRRTPH